MISEARKALITEKLKRGDEDGGTQRGAA